MMATQQRMYGDGSYSVSKEGEVSIVQDLGGEGGGGGEQDRETRNVLVFSCKSKYYYLYFRNLMKTYR